MELLTIKDLIYFLISLKNTYGEDIVVFFYDPKTKNYFYPFSTEENTLLAKYTIKVNEITYDYNEKVDSIELDIKPVFIDTDSNYKLALFVKPSEYPILNNSIFYKNE